MTGDPLPWHSARLTLRRLRAGATLNGRLLLLDGKGAVLGRLTGVPVVVAHEHTWSFEGRPLRRFLDLDAASGQ